MKEKINVIDFYIIVLQSLIVIICLILAFSAGKYDSIVLYSSTGIIAILLLLYNSYTLSRSSIPKKSIEENNENRKDNEELKLKVRQLLDGVDNLMSQLEIDKKEEIVNEISKFSSKRIERIWSERKKDIKTRNDELTISIDDFDKRKKEFEKSERDFEKKKQQNENQNENLINKYENQLNQKAIEFDDLRRKKEEKEREIMKIKDGIGDFNNLLNQKNTDILQKFEKYCKDSGLENAEKAIGDIIVKIEKYSKLNDKFSAIFDVNESILNSNLEKKEDKYQAIIDSSIRNYILWLKLYKWYQNTIRNEKSFLKVDIELAQITKNLFHSLLLIEADHWNYRILNGEKFDDLKPMGILQNASNYSTMYEDYIRYCRNNNVSLKVFMEKNILLPEQIDLGDN